jgi:endoglucanase
MKLQLTLALALSLAVIACNADTNAISNGDVFATNKLLAKSINFGNALEGPTEGAWGIVLEESYFEAIKNAGFTGIRLPIKFSSHALTTAPFTIDKTFMDRIDWAVNNATSRGLAIIVDMHHYDELMTAPTANKDRFLGMWQQIATHFKDAPASVVFEIHNEPNGNIEPLWNEYAAAALKVIRESNPTRAVIVGPNGWNSAWRLPELKLPDDKNLIVTFHNYEPFKFTHQGAEWVSPSPAVGVVWPQPGAAIRAPWQNWSWDTTLEPNGNTAFNVTYNKGYGTVYLHSDAGATGFSSLRIKTDQAVQFHITCMEKNPPGATFPEGYVVQTQPNIATDVSLSSCGNPTTVREIWLRNNTNAARATFKLEQLELVGATKTQNLFSNAEETAAAYLEFAAAWGRANNRPIFMGEFGAYGKADTDSRVKWTTFMRAESEKRGIAWAYWEFGAGFGAYDRTAKAWRPDLLGALIPK